VRHRGLRLLLALPLAGLLAGCGATTQQASNAQRTSSVQRTSTVAAQCRSGVTALGSAKVTVAAVVRQQARAYRKPARRAFADFDRLNQNGFPTVFRVHETPDPDKLTEYREFVISYGFKAGDLTNRRELQRLLESFRGKPEEQALKIGLRPIVAVNPFASPGPRQ
jgi:hypothetical protein